LKAPVFSQDHTEWRASAEAQQLNLLTPNPADRSVHRLIVNSVLQRPETGWLGSDGAVRKKSIK